MSLGDGEEGREKGRFRKGEEEAQLDEIKKEGTRKKYRFGNGKEEFGGERVDLGGEQRQIKKRRKNVLWYTYYPNGRKLTEV